MFYAIVRKHKLCTLFKENISKKAFDVENKKTKILHYPTRVPRKCTYDMYRFMQVT
jgi:hypothetical protein